MRAASPTKRNVLQPPDADVVAVLRGFVQPSTEDIKDILLGVRLVVGESSVEPILLHPLVELLLRHKREFGVHFPELPLVNLPIGIRGKTAVAVISAVVVVAELADNVVQRIRVVVEAVGISKLDLIFSDNSCSKSQSYSLFVKSWMQSLKALRSYGLSVMSSAVA